MSPDSHNRVLVVDDNSDVRNILTSVLQKRGLDVHAAGDGKEALDLLGENAYGVIVLDLVLPEIDGFEVLRYIQSDAMTQPAPVVLVLTGAANEIVDRLDPQRIHGLVRKPFDPEDLAALVLACADVKRRGPFPTMAIATMLSGAQLFAWLNRFSG
ncbi:MAG TPA: response regulator [Thermoanaerobaculia bacterium]|nr:response regulator [Thermoanaerobaculia bacterium]